MDIVYVLIGFVCGFLCDAWIHFQVWQRKNRVEKTKFNRSLTNMTLKEVEQMCKQVSQDIINQKKKEMENENNKV